MISLCQDCADTDDWLSRFSLKRCEHDFPRTPIPAVAVDYPLRLHFSFGLVTEAIAVIFALRKDVGLIERCYLSLACVGEWLSCCCRVKSVNIRS